MASQLGHIHIHEAEKALLEAIALLATSCICVPLVVSKIPGVKGWRSYLWSVCWKWKAIMRMWIES